VCVRVNHINIVPSSFIQFIKLIVSVYHSCEHKFHNFTSY